MGEFPSPPLRLEEPARPATGPDWRGVITNELGEPVGGFVELPHERSVPMAVAERADEGKEASSFVLSLLREARSSDAKALARHFSFQRPDGTSAEQTAARFLGWVQRQPQGQYQMGYAVESGPGGADLFLELRHDNRSDVLHFLLSHPSDWMVRQFQVMGEDVTYAEAQALIGRLKTEYRYVEHERTDLRPQRLPDGSVIIPKTANIPTVEEDAVLAERKPGEVETPALAMRALELARTGRTADLARLITTTRPGGAPQASVVQALVGWVTRHPQVLRPTEYRVAEGMEDWNVFHHYGDASYLQFSVIQESGKWRLMSFSVVELPSAQAALEQMRHGAASTVPHEAADPRHVSRAREEQQRRSTLADDLRALELATSSIGETPFNRPSFSGVESGIGLRRSLARQVEVDPNAVDYFSTGYVKHSTSTSLVVGTLVVDPADPTKAVTQSWSFDQTPSLEWEGDRKPVVSRTDRIGAELAALATGGLVPGIPEATNRSLYEALLVSTDPAVASLRELCQSVKPSRFGATRLKDGSGTFLLDFSKATYPSWAPPESQWHSVAILYRQRGGKTEFLKVQTVSKDRTGHRGAAGRDPELAMMHKAIEAICTVSTSERRRDEATGVLEPITRRLGQVVKAEAYGPSLNTFLTWLSLGRTDEALKFFEDQAAGRALLAHLTLAKEADYDTILVTSRGLGDPILVTIPTTAGPQTVELVHRGREAGQWLIQPVPPSRRSSVRGLKSPELSARSVEESRHG